MFASSKRVFTQVQKMILMGATLPLLLSGGGVAEPSAHAATMAQSMTTPASTPQTGSSPQQAATPQSKPDSSKTTLWLFWGCLCAFGFGYLIILWQRPLWLLRLPSEIPLPKLGALPGLKTVPFPIIQWLKYRPRVLDAWVTQRIDKAEAAFEERETVKERKIYIPLPVKFDERTLASLETDNQSLRKLFSQQEFRLLIVGEGGVGKTSLACKIAKWAMTADSAYRLCKHRMLPVLIEDELTTIESESPLLDAISLQLKNLRDDEKPVSTDLLKHLLEKRRILVIVDHLSEMSEASRTTLRLRDAQSPINALIVTSRVKDILGKEVTQTVLNPLRVSGNQLSIFMDAYLTQRNEREKFDDDDYFDALRRLSQIVTDERNITILFAKLYAEQMIAAAAGKVGGELPDNVPDLMLSYLNKLNRNPIEDRLPDTDIHRDAKHIAWICLEPTFRPGGADREAVLEMLAQLETGENAKTVAQKHLNYLENAPLYLIRLELPAKTRIRFTLDPLAEYLAGLHLVERFRDDTARWQWLLEQAKSKPGSLEHIRGFLLAVRDCCLAKADCKVPASVSEELGKLANLDLEAIAKEQQRRRIQRLKSELSVPELDDRLRAVDILGNLALHSYDAVAALVQALDNSEPDVRLKAVNFLAQAGWDTDTVAQGLLKRLSDEVPNMRASAAQALGQLGYASEVVVQGLLKRLDDENLNVRNSTVQALGQLGYASEAVVQGLLNQLSDEKWNVRNSTVQALGQLGYVSEAVIQGLLERLGDWPVRNSAFQALGQLGHASEAVVQGLLERLSDEFPNVRESTARALGQLGHASEAVVQGLLERLSDEFPNVRESAAQALGQLGHASEAVVQGLLERLSDEFPNVRESAARALGQLGHASEAVVQGLLKRLSDENLNVRNSAIKALGQSGHASEAVVQGLLNQLSDENWNMRNSTVQALGQLGHASEAVVQGLLNQLSDENWNVRNSTVQTLRELGYTSEAVVQGLLERLGDENWNVRNSTAQALRELGHASEAAEQSLLERLSDEDWNVRNRAVHSLGQLGHASEAIVQGLSERLGDEFLNVRDSAAQALGQLSQKCDPKVLNPLLKKLQDGRFRIRVIASQALGIARCQTPEVMAALDTACRDRNKFVREAAEEALKQIREGII